MGEELERLEAMIADDHGAWDLSKGDARAIAWAIDQIKAARTPAPATGSDIDVAAYAAYDARKLTAYEVGTRPAFRDGYAAGLRAARTPGVARLPVGLRVEQISEGDAEKLFEAAGSTPEVVRRLRESRRRIADATGTEIGRLDAEAGHPA